MGGAGGYQGDSGDGFGGKGGGFSGNGASGSCYAEKMTIEVGKGITG